MDMKGILERLDVINAELWTDETIEWRCKLHKEADDLLIQTRQGLDALEAYIECPLEEAIG